MAVGICWVSLEINFIKNEEIRLTALATFLHRHIHLLHVPAVRKRTPRSTTPQSHQVRHPSPRENNAELILPKEDQHLSQDTETYSEEKELMAAVVGMRKDYDLTRTESEQLQKKVRKMEEEKEQLKAKIAEFEQGRIWTKQVTRCLASPWMMPGRETVSGSSWLKEQTTKGQSFCT
jgi:hypothetical protein